MKLSILRFVAFLCGIFATTAVLGQTTYTWTGAADGTNIAVAGNWTTNGSTPAVTVPSGATQDTAQWIGVTSSNLLIWHDNPALPGTGFGTSGINLYLSGAQVNSVQLLTSQNPNSVVGINNITLDPSAGAFSLGSGNSSVVYNIIGRPAGGLHDWINNSSHAATIYSNVRWQAGGGSAYTLIFDGSGDWIVTNNLTCANNTPVNVAMLGSGTLLWAGPSTGGAIGNNVIASPFTFNAGTIILANSGLLDNQAIQNNGATSTLLVYDATAQSQTLGGVISGPISLKVKNGTLTLQGANTYSGTVELNGGEAIVNTTENAGVSGPLGVGGTISFTGGTLGFSVNNVFDYSSRFSTAASQAYRFDSAGQSVSFATGLTSSGGTVTKVGPGTITLAGAGSYSGTTTVSGGKLVFQGAMTGTGNISVADGAALGVTATGTPVAPGTLTVGTSAGATLEFNNVTSTTIAPLAPGTLSSAGTITVNINSGTFTPGQSYPLLAWTTGPAPTVSLGTLNGFIGNLSFTGNTLKLNITATAYKWTGANNGSWDTTTANNWVQNGGPVVFANGGPALLDDTLTANPNITITGVVQPSTVTFNNGTTSYSIASSAGNDIGGTASLSKQSGGTLTMSGGANGYTGVTTISGGTLSVGTLANGGTASDIGAAANSAGNLVFNGGTLQYTGPAASVDRLFTVGTGGGAIDASGSDVLDLSNAGAIGYSGPGARVLTLQGSNTGTNTLTAVLADNGGATSLAKSGAGLWVLAANNTYSGGTTIANGNLQIGTGGSTGSPGSGTITANGNLLFNRSGTLTVGVVNGNGAVTLNGSGTIIMPGNNGYQGLTTINSGTLQIGNGGATGSLFNGGPGVTNNGTIVFNSTGNFTQGGGGNGIIGTGNLIKQGSGVQKIIGGNAYSGWTFIDVGATLQVCEGNQGQLTSSVVTNNGILKFVRQDFGIFGYSNVITGSGIVFKDVNNANPGDVTLRGNNTYTNVTIIAGGGIILGDGVTAGQGSIPGNVVFTNSAVSDDAKFLEFNRPDNVTFSSLITGSGSTITANQGSVLQNGTGVVTLTANNSFAGGTTISNGTVQVGAGGTTGSIGTNGVTDWGALAFNRSDAVTFGGFITGTGSAVQAGSGTLTLTGVLTTTGNTTVSNGTLVLNPFNGAVGGNLNVSGGTLVPGAVGAVSTLIVTGAMNIVSGNVSVSLNKSLSPAQSNSLFSVIGAISATAGTVQVHNYGPALAVGNKFTLFNQPVTGGAALTVSGGGVNWNNNLAVDGSISVASIIPPPVLGFSHSGNSLQFSWAGSGYKLQSQTNSLTVGLSNNWLDYPGGGISPVTVLIDPTKGTVFFRLIAVP